MEIEHLDTLKIEDTNGDFIFVLNSNEMYYEYYDEKEDEDYQVLIYNGEKLDGFFQLPNADKYLTIFLNYMEEHK